MRGLMLGMPAGMMGQDEDEPSRILPEARIARLVEAQARRLERVVYEPGEIVALRADALMSPAGVPMLVVAVDGGAPLLDRPVYEGQGIRCETPNVLCMQLEEGGGEESLRLQWYPHWWLEKWMAEAQTEYRADGVPVQPAVAAIRVRASDVPEPAAPEAPHQPGDRVHVRLVGQGERWTNLPGAPLWAPATVRSVGWRGHGALAQVAVRLDDFPYIDDSASEQHTVLSDRILVGEPPADNYRAPVRAVDPAPAEPAPEQPAPEPEQPDVALSEDQLRQRLAGKPHHPLAERTSASLEHSVPHLPEHDRPWRPLD